MIADQNIIITTIPNSRYVGVYDDSGWKQADGVNLSTNIALLDELPTATGTFIGDVYEDGDEIEPVDYTAILTVEFLPVKVQIESGTITGVPASVSVTGEGINQFDVEHIDNTDLKDNIMQLYRR